MPAITAIIIIIIIIMTTMNSCGNVPLEIRLSTSLVMSESVGVRLEKFGSFARMVKVRERELCHAPSFHPFIHISIHPSTDRIG